MTEPHNRLGEDQDMSQWLEENGQGVLNGAPSLSPEALEELGRRAKVFGSYGPGAGIIVNLSDLRALLAAASRERDLVRERDEARANAEREFHLRDHLETELCGAIGSTRFMDPPDGGSVSFPEQVARMRIALEASEAREADLIRERDEARRRSDHWRDKALKDAAQIAALQERVGRFTKALEWALDNSTDSDHPHYPGRGDRSAWVFPYLVHGSPMGGGVGEAGFDAALEAVEDAIARSALSAEPATGGKEGGA